MPQAQQYGVTEEKVKQVLNEINAIIKANTFYPY